MEKAISLKVKEALARDASRGIIRADPADLRQLGAEPGDFVCMEGDRTTVARAMPCFQQDRGQAIVQMDGTLRENAGASIGKKVELKKVLPTEAASVVFEPLSHSALLGQNSQNQKYLQSFANGMACTQGDLLRVKLLGTGFFELKVAETSPGGIVQITDKTRLSLKGGSKTKKNSAKVRYEDIGGLKPQLHKIREMIELPLTFPQVFEHLGIDAPKGVLLSGPPGTGKTLIARAVANEANCYFTSVSGPEIMGKLYGESESRIRKIFEDARRNAPAVIFIDEIDSIAPRRDSIGEEKQVERRVVAQLLSLLDGLEARGQVVVIAATNLPNSIDPALRRPGRFDRELRVPVPDRHGRLEILQVHTNGMPLATNVDLGLLAELTHGYVGTDLAALAREAAMCTLRKLLPDLDLDNGQLPFEQFQQLEVSMSDFREAIKEIEPSAIREFFAEVPNVQWQEVGGLQEVKEALREAVELPVKYPEVYQQAGVKPPKGILLYGPPGTGKTLLAKAAASQTGVNFISVKGPEIMSKYMGESEKAIRQIFKTARQAAPAIVFFDEIDAVMPVRSSTETGMAERVIGQFLAELACLEELKDVLVLAATNRKDLIDPAILRSGRFDLLLEVPLPDTMARGHIFGVHLAAKPCATDFKIAELADLAQGMAGADIELACKKAALMAIKDVIKQTDKPLLISRAHLVQAIEEVRAQRF